MSDFEPGDQQPFASYHPVQPPQGEPPRDGGLSVVLGLALAFVLVPIQIPLWYVAPVTIVMAGLVQLVYILPLIALFRKLRRSNLAQGLIIGASVLFLLNATCLGLTLLTAGLGKLVNA
ncbi:MAG TPA: hypothetical protein VI756_32890 [Blastocatellia bacterium]